MKNGKPLHKKSIEDAQAYTKRAFAFKEQGYEEVAAIARSVAGGLRKLSEKIGEVINGKAEA